MLARRIRDTDEDELSLVGLLAAVGQGDRNALAELRARSSGQLLGVVLRMLDRQEPALEVLHDTYLRIWHNAANFVPTRGSATTWMMAIARGAALERLRRQRREVPLDELPNYGRPAEGGVDPLAALADSEAGQMLAAGLEVLEAGQCDCLLLAYYHGLTYDELAQGLGQPLGTVRSWIRRGLLRLRQRLRQRDTADVDPDQRAESGELVLGLLAGEERDRVERRMMSDTRLRALVDDWQNRLTPLARAVPSVEPPPTLWQRLETTLASPTALRQRPPLPDAVRRQRSWQGAGRWRVWAILATLALLGLGAWVVLGRL